MGEPAPATAFRTEPYDYAAAREIALGLGVSDALAVTLVRRGYATLEAARKFLDGETLHDPFAFERMAEVVALLLEACAEGQRITVHGDYDVDGVCATAILVGALRELGGECDWFIPDRQADGYGLTFETVERLAARGTRMLVTVDCGIGSAAEVAAARAAGMEAIVSDHHVPPDVLPDCPILHPVVSRYPCPDLCATGVAYKLSEALRIRGGSPSPADRDLDLVALATVADLVPLRGENRTLVRQGISEARRAGRPGLRALAQSAGIAPAKLDEGAFAFRLAPRINAAGRLYRADAGVELLLTDDGARAAEIADELDRANRERREAELRVLAGAEARRAELPDRLADAPALVLAGEGWHPGVVGIVASRLVERHWRPIVLLALDGGGRAKGSARSIPGFDLLAGLEACAGHLGRFGGHRAAAGLELDAAQIDDFREAFVAHAQTVLDPSDLVRTESIDAVVGGDGLGMELADELERLGPFGMGNPGVRLLVPSARLSDVRPMGEGKHARFSLESGPAHARGVAFGMGANLDTGGDPVDAAVKLEANEWNGTVEPRVVLRELFPVQERMACPDPCAACRDRALGEEWWERLAAELSAPLADWPPEPVRAELAREGQARERVDRRGGATVAAIADLLSSGESVLAVCADVSRRRLLAERAANPSRFAGGRAVLASGRCAAEPMLRRLGMSDGDPVTEDGGVPNARLVLIDYPALDRHPRIPRAFEHVVLVDPPAFEHQRGISTRGRAAPWAAGFLHLAWGEAESDLAGLVLEREYGLQQDLSEIYRALGDAPGTLWGDELLAVLQGPGAHPRTPELAARCLRVLGELGLIAVRGGEQGLGAAPHEAPKSVAHGLRVVSSERTQLERSRAYVTYRSRLQEGQRFLSSQKPPR